MYTDVRLVGWLVGLDIDSGVQRRSPNSRRASSSKYISWTARPARWYVVDSQARLAVGGRALALFPSLSYQASDLADDASSVLLPPLF